ncbi:MAG: hypothetical protein QGH25_23170 [Candidatus Latescibacteria bacterium]|jgi:hypothetical protein|nr:hypothetical protein [Candidatus Latescibacterota bacterium]
MDLHAVVDACDSYLGLAAVGEAEIDIGIWSMSFSSNTQPPPVNRIAI